MGGSTNHKVTLDELKLVREALLSCISCGTLDLVVVVVQTGNVCTGELGNFSCRASHTAPNVEDFVAVLNADFGGEVMFMACNGLVERFSVCEAAEMKGLSPSVLVQVCPKVVVTSIVLAGLNGHRDDKYLLPGESGIFCFPCLGVNRQKKSPSSATNSGASREMIIPL